MHADKTNRTALTLLGLVFGDRGCRRDGPERGAVRLRPVPQTVVRNAVSKYIGAHGSWIWAAAAVLAVLLALIMLRWLAALLLSTDRAGDLDDPRDATPAASRGEEPGWSSRPR